MAPVLFALFISVNLKDAFGDLDTGVKFQFQTSGSLFNHQQFKVKTFLQIRIIRDLLLMLHLWQYSYKKPKNLLTVSLLHAELLALPLA